MIGTLNLKMIYATLTTPSGGSLRLTIIDITYMCTKFDDFSFSLPFPEMS